MHISIVREKRGGFKRRWGQAVEHAVGSGGGLRRWLRRWAQAVGSGSALEMVSRKGVYEDSHAMAALP
ncbi:MAG: hypothetical protein AB2L14_08810 [Candidatus Xenobiia bacterium LiM19]